ncbi:MAG: alpha/beta hydrolase [Candidatus Velthaea sp.]
MEPIVVWRRPAKRGAHSPLVVLLHGRGADENDLIDVADALPRRYAYASLRAPLRFEGGGYTWFENRGVARPEAQSLRRSIELVRSFIDGPDAAPHARDGTYLFGFSAGMVMAGALLLDDPARFTGGVLLSGAMPLDCGSPAVPQRLAGMPVFYGRGSFDDVIPAPLVEASAAYLRDASGAALTMREYPHAHSISNRELKDIDDWFNRLRSDG